MKILCSLVIIDLFLLSSIADTQHFKSVKGSVTAGNFTYYNLITEGAIQIILRTKKGDADLYVSSRVNTPTYEPEEYCLHSATCGIDYVDVPANFPRPLGIGVYGHPSHEESDYVLELKVKEHFVDSAIDDWEFHERNADLDSRLEEDSIEEVSLILCINQGGRTLRAVVRTLFRSRFHRHLFRSFSIMTSTMLEFENQMFLDVLHSSTLLIAAKGLSIETVILNLIKVHCDSGNLVFVLGATGDDETYFISELESMKVDPLPKVINSESGLGDRHDVYLNGGVFFISSRILVVDFLKNRVPVEKVTGIIVLKAHRILDKPQDAFSLRLLRQKNHTAFINAFSRSPLSFSSGFFKVERFMKTLFVSNISLWPRFHALVKASLRDKQPQVIECHIELTDFMSTIQMAVLDCVHFCIKEIKRINPSLDTEDITVENAFSKTFYKILQSRLDPIWNQLSAKTKQLIADLKTLRSIISYLTQSDCVRLHKFLNGLRNREYTEKCGGWMMLDAAETIFVTSKKRITDTKQNLILEPNPKWKTLVDLLHDVEKDKKEDNQIPTVLVLVENHATIHQLKQVLTMGEQEMLKFSYHKFFGDTNKNEPKVEEEEEEIDEVESVTLTQQPNDTFDGNTTFTETNLENNEPQYHLTVVIQPFKKDQDGLFLPKTLIKLQPEVVIMYDVDVTAIRQIEVYHCTEAKKHTKVIFLMYGKSTEEQVYLTSLYQEKLSFEKLIQEKATIVIEEMLPGEGLRDAFSVKKSTREGGSSSLQVETPRVIVDIREFRSELPSLLHKRGIDIIPVFLQVGDYILSPEMCVERKSISDLIGSLNSGRMYNQALAMTRYYAKPILLIEFAENKPFALQGKYFVSNDMTNNDIQAKLQLLTLHFPRLRLVWSESPFSSAQLFHELKEGKDEPDQAAAASIGIEETSLKEENLEKYNIGIQDFVSKLPGVNFKNLRTILDKGVSLSHLLTLTQEELYKLLENKTNAEQLHKALHGSMPKNLEPAKSTFRAQGRGRGRPFRKKPFTAPK